MALTTPKNPNYAAVVVRLTAVNALDRCDNIAGAPVLGYQAIVGKDRAAGDLGIVFTAETQLSEEFARVNNQHSDTELNADPAEKGYLEKTRRVRAIKLRGHRSDALFLPLEALAYTGFDITKLAPGDTFDELNGHPICAKYEVKKVGPAQTQKNKAKTYERVDRKHFHLHVDTDNYFRVADSIPADAEIIVTAKYHGTSWRGANTVVARQLSWLERLAKKFGVRVQETEYDHVFGSRRVLKDINNPRQDHFYLSDIWSEYGARLGDLLPEGFIVFGELVGWTGDGAEIQAGYSYGLPKGTSQLFVYRVAQINPQGRLTDLSWDQTVEFCDDHGLKTVPVLWRGKHRYFDVDQYLDVRFNDIGYTQTLPLGANKKIVDEGVVVRVEGLVPYLAKAKSAKFFEHETKQLDEDVVDLETEGGVAA
ncbi:RNA ligase family protein [Nocardia sp. NPDC060249]|uniref:RNA ligase family protein n=1 Tax=Nocardia sp. NPDC060249 TaxID=3347082 RepID=UPI003660E987